MLPKFIAENCTFTIPEFGGYERFELTLSIYTTDFEPENDAEDRLLHDLEKSWDLVDATKETLQIGEQSIEKTDRFGSIIRKPADKTGQYLYLMRIPNWVYDQRQVVKQDHIDDLERDLFRERDSDSNEDGQYGKNRIKHELLQPRQPGFDD